MACLKLDDILLVARVTNPVLWLSLSNSTLFLHFGTDSEYYIIVLPILITVSASLRLHADLFMAHFHWFLHCL